jgi:hypothetical protein
MSNPVHFPSQEKFLTLPISYLIDLIGFLPVSGPLQAARGSLLVEEESNLGVTRLKRRSKLKA